MLNSQRASCTGKREKIRHSTCPPCRRHTIWPYDQSRTKALFHFAASNCWISKPIFFRIIGTGYGSCNIKAFSERAPVQSGGKLTVMSACCSDRCSGKPHQCIGRPFTRSFNGRPLPYVPCQHRRKVSLLGPDFLTCLFPIWQALS